MGKKEDLLALKERCLEADLPLKEDATNLVFGKGNPESSILFIGEAPGANEDLKGVPFVGAAGKELDKYLNNIGLTIEDVYIANILKYRPPENRDPGHEEIVAHTPYLVEQIKIIRPEVICTLGNFATKFVLSHFNTGNMKYVDGITKLHGRVQNLNVEGMEFKVIPLYHPAAILYRRQLQPEMEKDFQTVSENISGHAKGQPRLTDY